ncbi:hypothetical protein Tco_1194322 [Tanacetum coccineum]
MTSFDCRLKAIKACSACGNLHTSAFCCSKEKLKNKILVPMPESSQQHIKIERICFDCGDLLHGLNCLECDLTRKILEKAFQKFQNTSKSSNDNSNVVNAPREPFVVKQDPSVNSSQKSPLIDQKCCCECGDSLDGIFCQRCTCKSCGKGAHIGYNCPPKTPIISNPEPTKQTVNEILLQIPTKLEKVSDFHEEFADEHRSYHILVQSMIGALWHEPELGNFTMDVHAVDIMEQVKDVSVISPLSSNEDWGFKLRRLCF